MLKLKGRLLAGLGGAVLMASVPGAALAVPAAMAQGPTQTATQGNFGNLISALNNVNAQIGQLKVLTNDLNGSLNGSTVRLVNVNDVLNGNNVNALNNALDRDAVNVGVLQDVLNNLTVTDVASGNTISLSNFLNNNNVALNRVVAVDVLNGGITIFYQ